jgi:hypothetical protein
MQRHIIHKPQAVAHPCSAVVPCIIRDAPSMLRCLDLLEQIGMIPFFDTQDVVQTMRVQGFDVWSIRTQTVFGDDALEVGMILTQLGHKALGGITFTIILVRPITVDNRLRHERNDGPLVRVDDRGTSQLMRIGDGPIAVHPV